LIRVSEKYFEWTIEHSVVPHFRALSAVLRLAQIKPLNKSKLALFTNYLTSTP